MIRSFFSSALVLLCTALVETAVFSNITSLPAIPDLSLICVLYLSLSNGKLLGETTGFVSGLFLDFLSAGPFGLNCLLRTIIGYLGGMFNKLLNTEGFFIPLVLGLCATLVKEILLWIISMLYPSSVILPYSPFTFQFLFELGINSILTPFVFRFLHLFKNSLIIGPESTI